MTVSLDFQVERVNLERAAEIRRTAPRPRQRGVGPVRASLANAAQQIDRAGRLQSHLDVCVEATAALIGILYRSDADGQPANIDAITGLIRVTVPWSDAGAKAWGLRQWEARVLRSMLQRRLKERHPMPFDFNQHNSRWYLDIDRYPTQESAQRWLQTATPTWQEWQSAVATYHAGREKYREYGDG